MHKPIKIMANRLLQKEGKKKPVSITLCTGPKLIIKKQGDRIIFQKRESLYSIPWISPVSNLPCRMVANSLPGVIIAYYQTKWNEPDYAVCAAGIILVKGDKLMSLPGVSPETLIFPEFSISHLVIASTALSPHGVPCMAILRIGNITADEEKCIYSYPGNPFIIEGRALTTTAGRVHGAVNETFVGLSRGYVPHVYACRSSDNKRHGWALVMPVDHETMMENIPEANKEIPLPEELSKGYEIPQNACSFIKNRRIVFNTIAEARNEIFALFLGKSLIQFETIPPCEDGYYHFNEMVEIVTDDWIRRVRNTEIFNPCRCPISA